MTPHPSLFKRKIIHIDMDCFFAAVEMLDHPQYKGRPLAVGGKRPRSVLCTANYEARKFGVGAAMPTALALKKCPHLILAPPRFERYKELSSTVTKIFQSYTDLIEPLSLDEAFLELPLNESATKLAQEIRRLIQKSTGLTASAGIAPNKFLAKIASDWEKPNGQFTISPNEAFDFARKLDVRKIPGVGPQMEKKLRALGIQKASDILGLGEAEMALRLGSFGQRLHLLAQGIDERPLEPERERKGLSVETTFETDMFGIEKLEQELEKLITEFTRRLSGPKFQQEGQHFHLETLSLKVKTPDFQIKTIAYTPARPILIGPWEEKKWENETSVLYKLLNEVYPKIQDKGLRLIGVGGKIGKSDLLQLELFTM